MLESYPCEFLETFVRQGVTYSFHWPLNHSLGVLYEAVQMAILALVP